MQGIDFKGLGVAMVTPFHEDGSVDFKGLENLTKHLVAAGTEYLVVMGTTGESVTLSKQEKQEVLDAIRTHSEGKSKIVLGCGGSDTRVVVEEISKIKGVDGILSVSPAYNKPAQEGIYQHYASIAQATDLPIILYNVPGRTASNMLPGTTLRLARDFKNIVAIKEASGNLEQVADIIANKPEGFEVISGDDGLTLPMLSLGAVGVISVVGNAYPAEFRALMAAFDKGDNAKAAKLHFTIHHLIQLLFKEGNPGGIKSVLHHLEICKPHVRLPLVSATVALQQEILAELKKQQLI